MSVHYLTIQKLKKLRFKKNFFYDSFWVNKFVNKFIKNGNKKVVEGLVYKAFQDVKLSTKQNPTNILLKSLELLKPIVNVVKLLKYRRHGRRPQVILIPTPINLQTQLVVSLSWLVKLIISQKKTRRAHSHQTKISTLKRRSLSKSKKKIFYDRFYVALPNLQLNNLIATKFIDLYSSNYIQLSRFKMAFYVLVANNRIYGHYRWL